MGKKVLDPILHLNTNAAEENTNQIDGVVSAIGLRRVTLTKAVSDARREIIAVTSFKRGFVGRLLLLPALLHPALTWFYSCGMALPVDSSADKIQMGQLTVRGMRMEACTLFDLAK